MSLLTRFFPFFGGKKPSLPRGEMLALRPVRSKAVTWERIPAPEAEEADKTVLRVPRRDDLTGRLLSRLFQIPASRTIELDEFGGEIWEQCDGAHTLERLIQQTCDKYKLNRRQGEVSVSAFMRMLVQRRLIGLLKPAEGASSRSPEGTPEGNTFHGRRKPARPRSAKSKRRR